MVNSPPQTTRALGRKAIAGIVLAVALSTSELSGAIIHIVPPEPINITNEFFFDSFPLDLNDDGVDDLGFNNRDIQTDATPFGSSRIVSVAPHLELAAALTEVDFIGADIDDPLAWTSTERQGLNACVSAGGLVCVGNFRGGRDFLGVEFDISGQTHYGWVQIQSVDLAVFARIIDWAYESEPGVGIFAGQIPEPSAALLAVCGLAAVLSRRRR